jgi:hypothetical protein
VEDAYLEVERFALVKGQVVVVVAVQGAVILVVVAVQGAVILAEAEMVYME